MSEATTATIEGETDFFSVNDEAPLASNADVSADSNDGKKSKKEEKDEAGPSMFGRLFGRRKREPTIENGAADLLDDGRGLADGETATHEVSSDGSAGIASDEEEGAEKSGSAEDGSGEGSIDVKDTNDDLDIFRDFAQAPKYGSDDELAERMSLIGGLKAPAVAQSRQGGLGSKFKNILGFKAKQQELHQKNNESQSLLNGNYESDDEGGAGENGALIRSSNGGYHHNEESSESSNDDEMDELRSQVGEYRLESFYPGDNYHDDDSPYEASRQNLSGRIQGFGSESALAYNQNAMDMSTSGRFFMDTMSERRMSSMDLEPTNDRSGILTGVGRAVSNITHFLLQKRPESGDTERRRMLDYICELEMKLVKKEKELQDWKQRAEQLQLEVNRLNFHRDDDEERQQDSDGASQSEEDVTGGSDNEEGESAVELDERIAGVQEGTLIDMTVTKPVFDPLHEGSTSTSTKNVVQINADLMQLVAPANAKVAKDGAKDFIGAGVSSNASSSEPAKSNPLVACMDQ